MTEAFYHYLNANAHSMRGKIRKYATEIRLHSSSGRPSLVSLLPSFLIFFPLPFFLPSFSFLLSISVASLLSKSGNTGFNLQTTHRFFITAPVERAILKGRFYL